MRVIVGGANTICNKHRGAVAAYLTLFAPRKLVNDNLTDWF
jgi:hypothetical protein